MTMEESRPRSFKSRIQSLPHLLRNYGNEVHKFKTRLRLGGRNDGKGNTDKICHAELVSASAFNIMRLRLPRLQISGTGSSRNDGGNNSLSSLSSLRAKAKQSRTSLVILAQRVSIAKQCQKIKLFFTNCGQPASGLDSQLSAENDDFKKHRNDGKGRFPPNNSEGMTKRIDCRAPLAITAKKRYYRASPAKTAKIFW
jgi:hypothetical protein